MPITPNLDAVNIRQGTDSDFNFSRGNTLPLVARPFGMTHWCPQTDEGGWQFADRAVKLQGVRATRRPSPWMGDYGHFTVMALVGAVIPEPGARASFYRRDDAVFQPHYFRAHLHRYQTTLEVTPTARCACFRVTFPATADAQILLQPFPGESHVEIDSATGTISGYTRAGIGHGTPENFAGYFVAVPEKSPVGWGLCQENTQHAGATALTGERVGAYLTFATADGEAIILRVATSFISVEQARQNLARELGDRSFDDVMAEGAGIWEAELSRVTLDGATPAQRATFYSCLYRTFLFPRKFHEYDAENRPVHYSPYDGQVHPGEMSADNGFWDTYRTEYALLALLAPTHLGEIMRGWTNAMREGGWTPRWSNPGYCNCMIGTHLDNVVADAYLRGVRDFDIETAYRVIRRDATEAVAAGSPYGRSGLAAYLDLGYVPADEVLHGAARTMDFAYNDWGIAQVARALGHEEDAARFFRQAQNYRHTFDPVVGSMRGRHRDGSWAPFDALAWGGPFVEGSSWQGGWAVQHDPAGLMELFGGNAAFLARLDEMLAMPPIFHTGSYRQEIHEMSEMAAVDFGQYAHSNQPVHHVLYLYTCAGQPWKTQYWVRRVMDELYTPGTLPGDEDNGEMAAWYVLNALGLYPLCPGDPTFTLGSPLFPRATLRLDNGHTLVLDAPDNAVENVYVHAVTRDGQPYRRTWIAHDDLLRGGTLTFTMRPTADTDRALTADDLPYSQSRA